MFVDTHPRSLKLRQQREHASTLARSGAPPVPSIQAISFQTLTHSSTQRPPSISFPFSHFHTLCTATEGVPLSSLFPLHRYLVPPYILFSKSFNCNTYGSPRKCRKQKTYGVNKPFRCNTYKKQGGGLLDSGPLNSSFATRRCNQVLSFHTLPHSFCTTKNSTLLFSVVSALFTAKHPGWGRAILTFYPNSVSANSALSSTSELIPISYLDLQLAIEDPEPVGTVQLLCAALPRITEHGSRVTQSVTHLLFPLDRPTMNSASHLARFRHA